MSNYRVRLAKKLISMRGSLSQRQYAKLIGISKSTLHRLEEGSQNITIDSLEVLCAKLEIDVAELLAPE